MPQSKKSTSGMGSIRKITREINGKTYTYYEARYTVGFDLEQVSRFSAVYLEKPKSKLRKN